MCVEVEQEKNKREFVDISYANARLAGRWLMGMPWSARPLGTSSHTCTYVEQLQTCHPRGHNASLSTSSPTHSHQPIVLYSGFSMHNQRISVLEVQADSALPESLRASRVLVLDNSGNVHSMWRRDQCLTDSYWDFLACLPALVPKGPMALLGLGAGTVPRISAKYFPGCVYHGWELDAGVVLAARAHLGMAELEKTGSLVCHIGNALTIPSQGLQLPVFSGVVVDLFSKGGLIPALTKACTWRSILPLLSGSPPSARVIANLGEAPPTQAGQEWTDAAHTTMDALKAMREVWDGQVCVLHFQDEAIANNLIALTGPVPSQKDLKQLLPADLQQVGLKGVWSDGSQLLLQQQEERRLRLSGRENAAVN